MTQEIPPDRKAKVSPNLRPVCVVPRPPIVQVNIITLCSNLALPSGAYDGTCESKDDMDDRRHRLAIVVMIFSSATLVLWNIVVIATISTKQTSTFPPQYSKIAILTALLVAVPLVLLGILMLRSTLPIGIIVAVLAGGILSALASFSSAYWQIGTTANFNIQLTHFDSWYIVLGMFTAAGTGNIAAISERAREIQTLQMIFDMTMVVFVAGILVARFSEGLHSRRRTGASAHRAQTANSGSPEEKS